MGFSSFWPSRLKITCRAQHILRRGQLDVFHIAFRQANLNAHALRQRRVVRRAFAERIRRVRPADQLRLERLQRLNGAQRVARRVSTTTPPSFTRFTVSPGSAAAAAVFFRAFQRPRDDLRRHQRARAVVNRDVGLLGVRRRQPAAYALPACPHRRGRPARAAPRR